MTHQRNEIDPRLLDRLVDGELPAEQRRTLLLHLDAEPDGWRRCALAFLEAQAWGEDLSAIRHEPSEAAAIVQASRPQPVPAGRRPRVPTILAMAASFIMATLLMMGWQALRGPATPGHTQVASDRPTDRHSPAGRPNWEMVTVAMPSSNGKVESVRLPAIDEHQLDESWLNMPGAVPADVLQALQRTGHTVRQSRELVPMPTQDGRRLVVPIDQVEVNYVGNRRYQ